MHNYMHNFLTESPSSFEKRRTDNEDRATSEERCEEGRCSVGPCVESWSDSHDSCLLFSPSLSFLSSLSFSLSFILLISPLLSAYCLILNSTPHFTSAHWWLVTVPLHPATSSFPSFPATRAPLLIRTTSPQNIFPHCGLISNHSIPQHPFFNFPLFLTKHNAHAASRDTFAAIVDEARAQLSQGRHFHALHVCHDRHRELDPFPDLSSCHHRLLIRATYHLPHPPKFGLARAVVAFVGALFTSYLEFSTSSIFSMTLPTLPGAQVCMRAAFLPTCATEIMCAPTKSTSSACAKSSGRANTESVRREQVVAEGDRYVRQLVALLDRVAERQEAAHQRQEQRSATGDGDSQPEDDRAPRPESFDFQRAAMETIISSEILRVRSNMQLERSRSVSRAGIAAFRAVYEERMRAREALRARTEPREDQDQPPTTLGARLANLPARLAELERQQATIHAELQQLGVPRHVLENPWANVRLTRHSGTDARTPPPEPVMEGEGSALDSAALTPEEEEVRDAVTNIIDRMVRLQNIWDSGMASATTSVPLRLNALASLVRMSQTLLQAGPTSPPDLDELQGQLRSLGDTMADLEAEVGLHHTGTRDGTRRRHGDRGATSDSLAGSEGTGGSGQDSTARARPFEWPTISPDDLDIGDLSYDEGDDTDLREERDERDASTQSAARERSVWPRPREVGECKGDNKGDNAQCK